MELGSEINNSEWLSITPPARLQQLVFASIHSWSCWPDSTMLNFGDRTVDDPESTWSKRVSIMTSISPKMWALFCNNTSILAAVFLPLLFFRKLPRYSYVHLSTFLAIIRRIPSCFTFLLQLWGDCLLFTYSYSGEWYYIKLTLSFSLFVTILFCFLIFFFRSGEKRKHISLFLYVFGFLWQTSRLLLYKFTELH